MDLTWMKIGKNIHTENKKKVYRKPVINIIDVDKEVSLQMVSDPYEPPPGPNGVKNLSDENNNQPVYDKQQNPQNNNPFGGSTPEYQR